MSSLRRLLIILGGFVALAGGLWRTPLGSVEAQGGTAIQVDASLDRRAIDPRIYGVNWATTAQLQALNAPLHRWGGNSVTRYNWQLNADNRGADWYFESIPDASSTAGAEADDFISQSFAGGAQPMMTIPLIGWTAKIGSGRSKLAGFSAAKYGAQQDCDWSWYPDACNGVKTDGTNVTGNDPNDANVASTPAIQKAWVDHLVSRWGGAAGGGLRYYIYDNEPSLWHSTHRDVRPTGVRMTELRDAIVSYGTAIRQSDPAAILAGPEEWGWMGYFWSGYDQQYMNATGCYSCTPDRDANGGVDFTPWLLDQLHQRELGNGIRLLDVLTLHYYPQGGEFGNDTSSAMQQRRNRSTRSLWDPNYVDETWINDRVRLIPRMRDWVSSDYPGIATGITEYSWGADSHINGATTQADVLGIFGREGLNLATRWVVPDTATPTFKAFQMYRSYDGAKATFGDTSVRATVPNPDSLSAFAAVRTSDGALTVMAINKVTTSALVSLSLAGFNAGPSAQVWQLTSANSIQHLADAAVSAGTLTTTLPAQSITLFVVPAAGPALPALSIGDATLSEGNSGTTNATLTLTLSAAASSTVSVSYATADGTAVAGSDYTASSGTVSFAAGQTSKAVSVPVLGDTVIENDETFVVNLSGASGATLSRAQGSATIRNDDLPSLSIDDVRLNEGNSATTNAIFTVTLSAAAPFPVTVNYATANGTATAGSDYAAQAGNLTFTAGQISKTVSVPVQGDTTFEPDETFFVNLSSPSGATLADAQGLGTITNDDSGTPPAGAQAVAWTSLVGATASGNSLTKTVATGWSNAGAISTQQIASGDGYVEFTASETTTYRMLGLSNGNTNSNWDDIDFSLYEYAGQLQVYEAGTARGTFGTYVPGDILRVAVVGGVVKYSKNGSVFYTSPKTPVYPLLVDTALYSTAATLNNAMILAGSAGPTLSISDVSVVEGNSATTTARFTVTLSAASTSTVTVNYATADATATAGSDYVAKSGTLSFTAGTTSQFIDVTVNGDTVVEPTETFVVNLTSPVGATIADAQGVGTITNDDSGTPPAGAQAVAWTSLVGATASGNSLTKTVATGWSNAGAISTQQIASGDGYVEFTASETATYRMLGLSNGNTNSNWDDIDFSLYEYAGQLQVYEAGTARGTFGTYVPGDILRVAVVGGVVKYSKNGSVFYTSPKTPVYPLLVDTALYSTAATLNNAMILAGSAGPTLSISDVSVVEGNSATTTARFTVTLSAASTSTVTVNYATADVTATAGSDYVAKSGTLSFTAGTTSQLIDVTVNGDTVVEPTETFVVNLTSPVGATIADAQGVGTITNDDSGTPPAGAQAVAWTSLVGATASGNSLTKTAATGWGNAGAISTQQIASGDGYVEFTASETTTYRMLGLSNGNTNSNWDDIDFALYEYAGQLQVYEAGTARGTFGTYAPGDILRVAVVGGVVKYSKNGSVFYTSPKTPVYPLLVDTALYSTAATLNNAMIATTP